MVLSHDASCHIDWFPPELIKDSVPNWHYRHISDDVLPALKEAGVTDDQIELMTTQNPQRIFDQRGAY